MNSFTKPVLALLGTALALVVAIIIGLHFWQLSRSMASQSRVEASQAAAASNSAADAVNTVAASGEREAASEALTRSNEQQIRAAEGASDKVNPAVRDAGISALCRRQSYANDPRCHRS